MSDAHVLRWLRALPRESSQPPLTCKRKRPGRPSSPPLTGSEGGPSLRAGSRPAPLRAMDTPPPPKRHRALASRSGTAAAAAAVGDVNDPDEQTPRPSLPRGRLKTLIAPSIPSTTTTSQRTGSGSSPRKRRAQLEVEPEEPIEVRPLTGNNNLPRELLALFKELNAVADGCASFLHPSLRPELWEVAEEADRQGLWGYDIVETAFAQEAGGGGGGGSVVDDVPVAAVQDLLLAAARCHKRGQDENGWNQAVHFRLLRLALPPDGFVDFEPWYVWPFPFSLFDSSLSLPFSTTARITPDILPRSVSSGKKVDYCIIINGAEAFDQPAMDVTNEGSPSSVTPARMIELLRRKSPGTSINHTDFDALNKWPIAVSIETKRPAESSEQAELQIGIWQAAHWKMLEWQQRELRQWLLLPQAEAGGQEEAEQEEAEQEEAEQEEAEQEEAEQEEAEQEEAEQEEAEREEEGMPAAAATPLVFLPAIIVVGHDWKFVATTREANDRTVLWTGCVIGNTSTIFGIYRVIWCVRRLARYTAERYWPWYAEKVLGLRLGGED
ncbi:hypothetical protein RB595_005029 [Gaeumannomyces hyphopodioides]